MNHIQSIPHRLRRTVPVAVFCTLLPAAVLGGYRSSVAAAGKPSTRPHDTHLAWKQYEGGADSAQYSGLDQINKSNVNRLEQAWFYPTKNNGLFGFNPTIVDGVMYVFGNNNDLVALHADTGREIWRYANGHSRSMYRGLAYWESADRKDRRLFFSSNNMLHAVDAQTGKLIVSFGNNGSVDLREGLGRDLKTIRQIQSGTPGRIYKNLILMGSSTGEEYDSPPGDIRAYNVRTGKMVWIFHTVPHPGEYGYDTWPRDAWKYVGGVNDWAEFTIDEKRGIAYFALGSPTYDFYGADRIGANLFSDCVLALDAATGKYLWHYQAVHHDLWDYDLAAAPKLLTVRHKGKMVDVVAEAGKNGFLYVLDRVTGKPVWPIEERPVPPSTMPGEQAWPTQPMPVTPPPFNRQQFSPADVNPYIVSAEERTKIADQIRKANSKGMFTPPSTAQSMQIPGDEGGANWGAGAIDPTTGFLYVESKDAPLLYDMTLKMPKRRVTGSPETQGRVLYIQNCQGCHTSELRGQPPVIPSLIGVVGRIGAEHVRETVSKGAGPMPAFSDFSSPDLDALIAYLATPSEAHVPATMVADLMAPAKPAKGVDVAKIRYWKSNSMITSRDGYPLIKAPWSTLTAYDLNRGTIAWKVPLGVVPSLEEKGVTDTGSLFPRGGVVVTAGGLIFSGTKGDSTLWVYDKDTGKVLFRKHLPGEPTGIPAVYAVNGREYVAFSAIAPAPKESGREGEMAPAEGSATQGYYVFALPQQARKKRMK